MQSDATTVEEDLPLSLIGEAIGQIPADEFVERVKAVHSARKGKKIGANSETA